MTERLSRTFVVILAVATTAAFVHMVRGFLMTLLMAAIFAGLLRPLFVRLVRLCRGRETLAAVFTLLLLVVAVVVPALALLGVVASEAVRVASSAGTRVPEVSAQVSIVVARWQDLPIYSTVEPYLGQAVAKVGELLAGLGTFLLGRLQKATLGTVAFFFSVFLTLYSMFYFLTDGPTMLRRLRAHVPLPEADADRILDRFLSVTRATLKGVLLIATIQGTINGFAFWLVGIDGAVFWGVLMIVLSIIPVVGGAIVWVPAAGYLLLTGQFAKAGVLFVVCGLLAGSIDNVLRPRLVGRDTQMHDLLIFCSTLGGLDVFGPQGFIVGPILAALFLTVWDIFAVAFRTPPGVSASVGGAPGTQAPGA